MEAPDVGRSPRSPQNIDRTWAFSIDARKQEKQGQGGIVELVDYITCSKMGILGPSLQGEMRCYCPFCLPFNHGGFKQNTPILPNFFEHARGDARRPKQWRHNNQTPPLSKEVVLEPKKMCWTCPSKILDVRPPFVFSRSKQGLILWVVTKESRCVLFFCAALTSDAKSGGQNAFHLSHHLPIPTPRRQHSHSRHRREGESRKAEQQPA